jgi:hypothetical protein
MYARCTLRRNNNFCKEGAMPLRFPLSDFLRVIGQLLEQQGLDVFDLRFGGETFSVQCADPKPPYLNLIHMTYSVPQLSSVDQQARQRRRPVYALGRFDGLPEILRAVGRRVEDKGGELLRVCNSFYAGQDLVILEYQTRDRGHRQEEIPVIAIRDQAQRMYRRRTAIRSA